MKSEIEALFADWVRLAQREARIWEEVKFLPQPPKAWLKAMQLAENARRAFELAAGRQGGHTAR